jgi:hypothetical protein
MEFNRTLGLRKRTFKKFAEKATLSRALDSARQHYNSDYFASRRVRRQELKTGNYCAGQ